MSEGTDPLLRALGEVERDHERRYPAAWEAVVAGHEPASAAAAERASEDPPEEHAAFAEMFGAAISDAEVERLVERGSKLLAEEPVAVAPPRKLVPMRRRVQIAVVAVLAIAAAVVLWRLPGEAQRGTQVAYVLTVRNDAVEPVRSTDAAQAVAQYREDSAIDWVLSPEQAHVEEVALRVVARAPDGREVTVKPVFTRSAEGALRLRGRLDAVLPKLRPGRWQLRFEVGPRDAAVEVGTRLEISLAPAG